MLIFRSGIKEAERRAEYIYLHTQDVYKIMHTEVIRERHFFKCVRLCVSNSIRARTGMKKDWSSQETLWL